MDEEGGQHFAFVRKEEWASLNSWYLCEQPIRLLIDLGDLEIVGSDPGVCDACYQSEFLDWSGNRVTVTKRLQLSEDDDELSNGFLEDIRAIKENIAVLKTRLDDMNEGDHGDVLKSHSALQLQNKKPDNNGSGTDVAIHVFRSSQEEDMKKQLLYVISECRALLENELHTLVTRMREIFFQVKPGSSEHDVEKLGVSWEGFLMLETTFEEMYIKLFAVDSTRNDEDSCEIHVSYETTVREFKTEISHKLGIPIDLQRLVVARTGMELRHNDVTLGSAKLWKGDRFVVEKIAENGKYSLYFVDGIHTRKPKRSATGAVDANVHHENDDDAHRAEVNRLHKKKKAELVKMITGLR
ncbi:hypothetical protein HDV00_007750 [Rhizophlyctis rosea]|nr:hypothetical protein HDV00_007750 [Rhizophlyctis rosea]